MIYAFSSFPLSLPCLEIVQIDLVNRSVNCTRNAYMYALYVHIKFIIIKMACACIHKINDFNAKYLVHNQNVCMFRAKICHHTIWT